MTDDKLNKIAAEHEETQKRLNKLRTLLGGIRNARKFIEAVRDGKDLHNVTAAQITAYNRHGTTVAALAIHVSDLRLIAYLIENDILPRMEAEYEQI